MKTLFVRHLPKYWLLWGLISCPVISGFAVEFEVEGNVTRSLYAGTYLQTSTSNHFIVSVRGTEWGITTWELDDATRVECYKDTNFLRTAITTFTGGTDPSKAWVGVGWVEKLEHPSNENPLLQAVWLAYCSSAYLQSITNGQIEPVWQLDNPLLHKQGFTLAGKWTLDELPPHLPSELYYISDGTYHGFNSGTKQPKDIKLRTPYDLGYTCAVFQATSKTNFNGIGIPLTFYFENSQTPLGNKTPMPRSKLFGTVESVKAHTDVVRFLPPYQGEISIHDSTEAGKLPPGSVNSNYMIYKGVNGDWSKSRMFVNGKHRKSE